MTNTLSTSCVDDGVAVEFTIGPLSAGQTKAKGVLHCYGDSKTEFDNVAVNDPTVASGSQTAVTVNLSSSTYTETEGNNTHPASTIKINVSGGNLTEPQVVNFTCTNGTASQNTHYKYVKGFTIPAGNYATAQTLTLNNIDIIGDATCNANRTFTISIDASDNCNNLVGRGTSITSATVTIADDEAAPVITNTLPNLTYYRGQAAPGITLTADLAGSTFAWTNSNTNIGLTSSSGTGNIPSFTAANTTTGPISATITVTATKSSCVSASKTYTITVYPNPTITYDYNGGTAPTTANPTSFQYSSSPITISNEPTRLGYTFRGWTCTQLNVTTPQKPFVIPANTGTNLTLRADWGIVSYTVGYTLNGGTVEAPNPNPTAYDVTTASFTLKNPVRTGYTFKGWSGTGLSGDANTSVTVPTGSTGNRTYTANWTVITYNITYTLNGGTAGSPANPTTYTVASSNITLSNPTKTGYTFNGWTGANGSTAQTTVTIPAGSTGNKSYTANWTRNNYTISYTTNNTPSQTGQVVAPNPANPTTYHVETATITLNNPSHPGYTFKGWTGANGTTPQLNVTIPVGSTGDKTYTANWALEPGTGPTGNNFTLSYTINNAPSQPGQVVAPSPANPTTYNIETATFTLRNPSHPGYTFTGWTGANGTTPQLTVQIPVGSTGNKSYTANWALAGSNTFTIDYTINNTPSQTGQVVAPNPANPTTYTIETSTFTLRNPSHPGYTFKGWTGSNGGTPQLTVQIPVGSTGNRTYTANWELAGSNDFTISYTINNVPSQPGQVVAPSPANPTTYNIETNTFTLRNPSHPGYTFKGWTGTNGTTPQLTVTIPVGSTGNRTYTANWALEPGTGPTGNNFTLSYTTANTPTLPALVSVNPANPVTYNIETATFTLTNPTHPGYTFTGWSGTGLTGNNNMTVTVTQGSTGNRTYTAHWSTSSVVFNIGYTLTVPNGNGAGTVSPANPTTYTIESSTITLTNPTHPGYTFTGWSGTGLTGNNNMTVQIPTGSTGNRTYTAHWSLEPGTGPTGNNFTIEYTINNVPSQPSQVVPPNPANPLTYNIETATITLNNPSHPGYTFKGWTGSNGTTPQLTVTIPQGSTGNRTYTANWALEPGTGPTGNNFTISYTINNVPSQPGQVVAPSPANPTTYNIETNTFTLRNPSHPGYTFKGWTGSNGTTPQTAVTITQGSTGDRTYTANWALEPGTGPTGNNFTISYTINNAPSQPDQVVAPSPANPVTYNVETATFTLNNPSHPGYTFKGWTGSNGTTPQLTVQIAQGSTGNKSYTANWALESGSNTFSISYTIDNAPSQANQVVAPSPANPTTYTIETNTITLNNPSHPGYTFKGWTGSNGTTPQLTVTIPQGSTGNKSYTANWALETGTGTGGNNFTIDYTISNVPSRADLVIAPNPANPTTYNIETNTFTLNNPSHPGYTFKGWTGSNGTTPQLTVTIAQGSTGNKTYTANWALNPGTGPTGNNFTLSYTLTTPSLPALVSVSPANPTTYNIETATFTLTNPTHPGYTFTGWSGTGLTGNNNMTVQIPVGSTGNRDYTAHWSSSAVVFNIDYTLTTPTRADLITDPANPATYTIETATITLGNPSHPGYTFTGWSGTGLTGNNNMNVQIPAGSHGDRTYTAHWSAPLTFTIGYTLNGGTVSTPNPTSYTVETNTFTLTNPTRTGWTFKGWTGTDIAAGDTTTSVSIAKGSTGNRLYTAHWEVLEDNAYTLGYTLTTPNGQVGTVSPANPIKYFVTSPPITLHNPTHPGYTFTGWSGTGLTGNGNTTVTIPTNSTGHRTYTAHWSAPTVFNIGYTLTPPSLPALVSVSPANPLTYTIETATITLTNPTHPGYTFKGWTGTDIAAGDTVMTVTIPTGSHGARAYTAHWSLESGTGTGGNDFEIDYTLTTPTLPGLVTVDPANRTTYNIETATFTLTNPTHPGYTFKGWSGTGLTGDNNMTVQIPTGSYGNRSYTAHWALEPGTGPTGNNFNIVYTLTTPTLPGLVVVSPANPTTYNIETATITLTNPTHPGYTFTGWSGTDLTGNNNMTVQIPVGSFGDRAYTAHWDLDTGGNTFSIGYTLTTPTLSELVTVSPANPTSYNIETATITLTNPTHPGYTFKGWSGTDLTGTDNMTVTIPTGSYGNRTYTAHWALEPGTGPTGNNFTLSYTLTTPSLPALVSVIPANPTTYNIETDTITLTNPTHPGYTFTGWSGTDLTGNDNLTVRIPKGSYGNRAYTAHWALGTGTGDGNFHLSYTTDNTPTLSALVSVDPANPTEYNIETPTFTLTNPTHPGYTFTGWSGDSIAGNDNLTVQIPTGSYGDRSHTAHWALVTDPDPETPGDNEFPIDYTLTTPTTPGLVTVSPANPAKYHIETPTFTLTNPTHPGYTFKGWTGTGIATGDTVEIVTITRGSYGPRDYTAHWSLGTGNAFNISYTLTSPTQSEQIVAPSPANPTSYDIETETFTLNNPSHPGYTFKGWTGTNGTTPQTTVTITKGSFDDRTYTANWELVTDPDPATPGGNEFGISYTLTPPSQPGLLINPDPANPLKYHIETPTFTLNNPSHPGYTFKGWTGSNGATPQPTVTVPTGSTGAKTFTAKWEIDPDNVFSIAYTIDNTPSRTDLVVAPSPANPTTYNIETATFTLNNPSHPGYTFTGWTGSNGTTPQLTVTIATGSTENRTYEANWELVTDPGNPLPVGNEFGISYTLNGGSATNPGKYHIETPTFTLNNPTRPGYTFTGWSGTGLTGSNNTTVTVSLGSTGDRDYEAHWSIDAYTITYDPNGGSLPLAVPAIWQGYDMEHLPTAINILPTRPGYTFKGWDGHGLSSMMAPFAVTTTMPGVPGDLTFVAQWELNIYNISYDYYVPGNPLTYDVTQFPNVTIPLEATHLDPRHVFIGWKSPELPTVPKQLVYSVPTGTLMDLTFQAQWSQKLDDLNGGTGDSLFVCEAPRTLYGDPQAQGWIWTLPDGSEQTTRNVTAYESGRYICLTDYGTKVLSDTLHVYFLADVNTRVDYITLTGAKIGRLLKFVLRLPEEVLSKTTVEWVLPDGGTIINVSATSDTLTAMWDLTGEKHIVARLSMNHGGLICTKSLSVTVKITERGLGFFVNQNVSGGEHDGSSWANAYRTIDEALTTATQGDRIWVARGTYTPETANGSFTIAQDSIEIYGGFNATEEYLYERDVRQNETIMRGAGNSSVVKAENSTGIRIDGFTIENGRAERGAGVLLTSGSTGTLANSIVRKNVATSQGGGIFASAPWYGYDGMSLVNVEVSGNQAATGGGIYNDGGSVLILNVTVSGNKATQSAGGLYNEGISPRILNTIIWGNISPSDADVRNVGGNPSYRSSLIGGSRGSGGNWNTSLGTDGGGNKDVNPLFLYRGVESDNVTLRDGNYRLSGNSEAVDAGSNYFVLKGVHSPWSIWLLDARESLVEGVPTDLDYNARIADDDVVDMGAYEYNSENLHYAKIDQEVILPIVDGVTTNPGSGIHYVPSRGNFVFTVTPSARYAGQQLVVTTSRTRISDSEGVGVKDNGDGTYTVTIYAVQDKTYIYISFGWDINEDSELLSGSKVWAYGHELHVLTTEEGKTLRIYNLSGQLQQQQPLPTGETVLPLPTGVYVVSLDDSGMSQKVVIR